MIILRSKQNIFFLLILSPFCFLIFSFWIGSIIPSQYKVFSPKFLLITSHDVLPFPKFWSIIYSIPFLTQTWSSNVSEIARREKEKSQKSIENRKRWRNVATTAATTQRQRSSPLWRYCHGRHRSRSSSWPWYRPFYIRYFHFLT